LRLLLRRLGDLHGEPVGAGGGLDRKRHLLEPGRGLLERGLRGSRCGTAGAGGGDCGRG